MRARGWRCSRRVGTTAAFLLALLLILLPVLPLAAQTPASTRYQLDPAGSRVWFEAQANMGGFTGEARAVSGWGEVAHLASLQRAQGVIEIQAASFRTGIGLRDRHLREEMQADRFPVIRFTLSRIDTTGGPQRESVLHGRLTVRNVTREVAIPARVEPQGSGLRVQGSLPLRLTDYGIDPPVRLAGLARMRDELVAHIDALFLPATR